MGFKGSTEGMSKLNLAWLARLSAGAGNFDLIGGQTLNLSMRLLRLSDVEHSPGDRLFRYSPLRIVFLVLAVACVGDALLLVGWEGRGRSTNYVAYYIAGVLFLGLVLMRRFFLARLRSSNWLARMRDDGLLIQFRSYLNYHLPSEDLTVVFIPYQDIRSARLLRERTEIQTEDGPTKQIRRLIELELDGDLRLLSKALAVESAKPAPREKTWYGNASTLYKHYPVRMVSSPFCRWNGRSCRAPPSSWMLCDRTQRLAGSL
jgi:hypothetical protein